MNLVRALLPLATTLTVGSVGLFALQMPLLFVPPPAPASQPLASPPALAAKPFALPPAFAPQVVPPAPNGDTEYKGARILLRGMTHIPACRLVFCPYQRVRLGPTDAETKREHDFVQQRQAQPSAGKPPVPR